MNIQLERRLVTVEEYHLMGEVGILTEEDKVELLNGEIIKMSPTGSKHAFYVDQFAKMCINKVKESAEVRIQNPVRLSELSEPEPDIALAKTPASTYLERHPGPEDIYFLVEISDSTLQKDREIKLPLYAAAGVPEVWIVNIEGREIEVYRNPKGKNYGLRILYSPGEVIEYEPLGMSFEVDKILH